MLKKIISGTSYTSENNEEYVLYKKGESRSLSALAGDPHAVKFTAPENSDTPSNTPVTKLSRLGHFDPSSPTVGVRFSDSPPPNTPNPTPVTVSAPSTIILTPEQRLILNIKTGDPGECAIKTFEIDDDKNRQTGLDLLTNLDKLTSENQIGEKLKIIAQTLISKATEANDKETQKKFLDKCARVIKTFSKEDTDKAPVLYLIHEFLSSPTHKSLKTFTENELFS